MEFSCSVFHIQLKLLRFFHSRKLPILCRSRKLSQSVDLVSLRGQHHGVSTERWWVITTDELQETDRFCGGCRSLTPFCKDPLIAVQFLHLPVWTIGGVNEMTASFVHFLRSNERGLTQRAFLLPLTIAPQRISHPAPPPPYCNSLPFVTHETIFFHFLRTLTEKCCVYRQSQHIRNIAEDLDPTFQARRQGTESQRVEHSGTVNRKRDSQNETAKQWTVAQH